MSILDKFGVKEHELSDQRSMSYPPTVKGREVHIDGDFLAYMVSAHEDAEPDSMKHNLDVAVETFRLLGGAEKTFLHLTASYGDKGGRYDQAIQKEYQGNRDGKEKPKYLNYIKTWMYSSRGAIMHEDQEADDGLCQAVYHAEEGKALLVSKDKDLDMCLGMHMDWETGDITKVTGFGDIWIDGSTSVKKIKGKGTKFFWAQMLMGDNADNIQGLPCLLGSHLNKFKPTAAIIKAEQILSNPESTPKQMAKALTTLESRKNDTCGAVTTFSILEAIDNDLDAHELISGLYEDVGKALGFKHWKTGKDVDPYEVYLSEAKLLWIRRHKTEKDFENFIQGLKHD